MNGQPALSAATVRRFLPTAILMLVHWRLPLLLAVLCLGSALAAAHSSSSAFLSVDASAQPVQVRLDLNLADLSSVADVDLNRDGELTWAEIIAASEQLTALWDQSISLNPSFKPGLKLDRSDAACAPQPLALALTEHLGQTYLVLQRDYVCAASGPLAIHYGLLFELDPSHRALAEIRSADGVTSTVFSPANRTYRSPTGSQSWALFGRFWSEGLVHILHGFDHLLFLITLLLPAVLVRGPRGWQPQASAMPVIARVTLLVTAFTIGHSLTLALVMLNIVPHPGSWVEPLIALSIVLAALNNLAPLIALPAQLLALGLGLIHGFGFANVLQVMNSSQANIALPLAGFNLGVESGQLLVVAVLVPLLYGLRKRAFYSRGILLGGSCSAALLGFIWMLEAAHILN